MAAMEAKGSEAKVAGPSQQTASASTGDSELDQKVAEWLALDQEYHRSQPLGSIFLASFVGHQVFSDPLFGDYSTPEFFLSPLGQLCGFASEKNNLITEMVQQLGSPD
ncbi:unnamed protein product [Porites evermanni]|uniref:Uncharacterized protein n=1 Tax=Porites evermanni TaxID=104178 RepID=A0ABN8LJD7_9CNID|nr:unnamed protein product [Porites evermanni]